MWLTKFPFSCNKPRVNWSSSIWLVFEMATFNGGHLLLWRIVKWQLKLQEALTTRAYISNLAPKLDAIISHNKTSHKCQTNLGAKEKYAAEQWGLHYTSMTRTRWPDAETDLWPNRLNVYKTHKIWPQRTTQKNLYAPKLVRIEGGNDVNIFKSGPTRDRLNTPQSAYYYRRKPKNDPE
jgi:hypothetical protein